MFQPNLPGIEEYLNSPGEVLENPESIIQNLEQKGYELICDEFTGEPTGVPGSSSYASFMVKIPSGKILNEGKIKKEYSELEN